METVAIKNCSLLDTSPARRKMLLRELRALAQLDCCHLVRFYGAFLRPGDEIENEEVAIVLEYMDLGSLRQHIPRGDSSSTSLSTDRGRRSGFPESILASILYQMIAGLSYLHERKILHRDLKTDNVLLMSTGHVKLCDFGVSTILDDSVAMGQTLIGTALFMAPERLRAQPHNSLSDIWSLGLVGLECWTGHVPWSQQQDDDIDNGGGGAGSASSSHNSIIELIMTIEEMDAQVLVPAATMAADEALRELLIGCLQVQPGTFV
jgi:serine/threonine protein kinase